RKSGIPKKDFRTPAKGTSLDHHSLSQTRPWSSFAPSRANFSPGPHSEAAKPKSPVLAHFTISWGYFTEFKMNNGPPTSSNCKVEQCVRSKVIKGRTCRSPTFSPPRRNFPLSVPTWERMEFQRSKSKLTGTGVQHES